MFCKCGNDGIVKIFMKGYYCEKCMYNNCPLDKSILTLQDDDMIHNFLKNFLNLYIHKYNESIKKHFFDLYLLRKNSNLIICGSSFVHDFEYNDNLFKLTYNSTFQNLKNIFNENIYFLECRLSLIDEFIYHGDPKEELIREMIDNVVCDFKKKINMQIPNEHIIDLINRIAHIDDLIKCAI